MLRPTLSRVRRSCRSHSPGPHHPAGEPDDQSWLLAKAGRRAAALAAIGRPGWLPLRFGLPPLPLHSALATRVFRSTGEGPRLIASQTSVWKTHARLYGDLAGFRIPSSALLSSLTLPSIVSIVSASALEIAGAEFGAQLGTMAAALGLLAAASSARKADYDHYVRATSWGGWILIAIPLFIAAQLAPLPLSWAHPIWASAHGVLGGLSLGPITADIGLTAERAGAGACGALVARRHHRGGPQPQPCRAGFCSS